MTLGDSIAMLAAAWQPSGVSFDKSAVAAYLWGLNDMDPEEVEGAVREAIREHRYPRPPTVADLRERIAERRLDLPGAGKALEMVEARVTGRSDDLLPEPARRALDIVGGSWAWRTTEDPAVLRGQFRRYYEEFRQQEIRVVVRGLPSPPEPPALEQAS